MGIGSLIIGIFAMIMGIFPNEISNMNQIFWIPIAGIFWGILGFTMNCLVFNDDNDWGVRISIAGMVVNLVAMILLIIG